MDKSAKKAFMTCPECGKVVHVTRVNELRVHDKPTYAGGGRCPLSGRWIMALDRPATAAVSP